VGRLAGAVLAVANAPLVGAVTAAVTARDGERVLDVGFGPGVSPALLDRAAPTVELAGIDPSAVMVRAAARRTAGAARRPDLRQGEAAALPWPDQSFDAACASNSVQLWQSLAASMAGVRRVLRPHGRLVLGVHERAVLPAGGTAGRRYDQVLVPALQAAGFTVTDASYHPPAAGRRCCATRDRPHGPDPSAVDPSLARQVIASYPRIAAQHVAEQEAPAAMGPMMGMMGPGMWLWAMFPFALLIVLVAAGVWLLARSAPAGVASGVQRVATTSAARRFVFDTSAADTIRAADADRAGTAAELEEHLASGRISLGEFDDRVRRAYAATTLGELRALLVDLPSPETR
jgi:SAM-dependent methyltransferase